MKKVSFKISSAVFLFLLVLASCSEDEQTSPDVLVDEINENVNPENLSVEEKELLQNGWKMIESFKLDSKLKRRMANMF